MYEKGLEYTNQKNFIAAEECFKEGLKEDNTNSMCLNGYGAILIQKNEYLKAIDYLEKSLSYEPNNVKALSNLGLIFLIKGEIEIASSYYEKAISIDSSDPTAKNQKLKLTHIQSTLNILKENIQSIQSFVTTISKKCSHKTLQVNCDYCSEINSTINNKLDVALKSWLNLLDSYELRYLNNTELIQLINQIICRNINNLSNVYPPDIFNYPLNNWKVEKVNEILHKMLFYCKGLTIERHFEDEEEIVNIRETMEYLYYTYFNYETTRINNIYKLNFVHKIYKNKFSIYCFSDNIGIFKELPFYFNVMPFGIEQNGAKVLIKLQNDIIKPITSLSILGVKAEHSYMNQFYPNKHFIQKLTEYKSNDQTFKVDILTTVDDDDVIFDISEFFGK